MKGVEYGSQANDAYQALKSRDFEDDEDLFVRDLDAFDDLEAREPGGVKAAKSVFFFIDL